MSAAYEYEIHLPSNREPGRRYPVIFTLHGKGSNERNMMGLVASLSDSFILIGIRGNLPLGAGYQYYELKSLGNPIREMFDRAVADLDAFIEYATAKYPIDASRRYLLGFSQGAILSMTLALTMGDRLKGIAALNGYVPEFVKTEYPLRDIGQVKVWVSHGQFDSIFPLRIGEETAAYFRPLIPEMTFRTYPTDHGVSERNQEELQQWLKECEQL